MCDVVQCDVVQCDVVQCVPHQCAVQGCVLFAVPCVDVGLMAHAGCGHKHAPSRLCILHTTLGTQYLTYQAF